MRIGGLASGMDIDSLVEKMMKAERTSLDKVTQKKQYTEWQLEDYRSVNRKLNDYSNNLFDTMMKQSTFLAKTVTTSSPDAVSVKSMNATSEFSGSISVSQLAAQASLQSKGVIKNTSGEIVDTKATLASLGMANDISITINTINKDGKFSADNEKTLTFSDSDTIESVLKKINSETGVTAFYDSFTGKIAMTAKNSGKADSGAEIVVSGNLAEVLKIDGNSNEANGKAGQNAKFTFNGLETERNNNAFQINGFEVTLKQTTSSPVTFSSAPDTDKIVDSVKKFVEDYNKLIEELNSKIRETKYRNYSPLTASQKEDMKEKEIELWEEKAKSGTLKNDSTISSMLQSMRSVLNGAIEGTSGTIRLSDIGITTSKDYSTNGKLEINETKLREAINSDPNKVYEVFAKSGSTTEESGLATQVRAIITDSRKNLTDKAGITGATNNTFSIGRALDNFNQQISRLQNRLTMVEDRYWKQFTAMENAINRANSQSASIAGMFS
ncbi:flagellar hook-associated protein 2 [uncultured Psychrobacillus sp.]|mgnify:CR=1 FL=1|uniref:flagellar hook-associated protein 2 n=1 Tax=uncultured Psychrobacillus sp. TaxID=1551585 RepID=UPI0026070388|nr:flagellar hook-associated protein 2 [uncultured Psychrobacillus sp.]